MNEQTRTPAIAPRADDTVGLFYNDGDGWQQVGIMRRDTAEASIRMSPPPAKLHISFMGRSAAFLADRIAAGDNDAARTYLG